jgi:gluconate 5-dehydrogenase
MNPSFSLQGRVALVTGSTRGLGLAIAESLSAAGAHVVLHGREKRAADARATEFKARGFKASAVGFDVKDREAGPAAIEAIAREHGRIDILVNNAGITHRDPVLEFPDAKWDEIVEVNLTACFRLARAAGKHMVRNKWGRIVNLGSIASTVARTTIPAYVATKHAILGLTKALAAELGAHNVTCNAVAPGYFVTDLSRALKQNPEFDSFVRKRTPLGRWAEPRELGPAIVFLASEAGSYVNGHLLAVDGGIVSTM